MLRVVSFNTFYAIRKKRLGKSVFETFADLDPDVICLQEVLIGKKSNFARDLADHLGYHLSFSLRAAFGGRQMGLAVLTKKPAEENTSIILPHSSPRRPRILQTVTFQSHGVRWRIANTHLNHPYLAPFASRRTQLKTILTELDRTDTAIPSILVGDFNTKSKKEVSAFTEVLRSARFQTPKTLPYSSRLLGMKWCFDWIAARNCTIQNAAVLSEVKGSDHKPIWADIAIDTK